MISLGAIIYLIARAAPRVGDTADLTAKNYQSRLDKFIASLPIEKLDFIFSSFLEKILRKMRVFLLKWDNLLTKHLNKIVKSNGDKEKSELFGENGEMMNDEK
jgi:hypothetical protein